MRLTDSTRAVLAGAIGLAIIGGMIVGHAWPLWTGEDVLMAATADGTNTWTRGEYVRLSTTAERLKVGAMPGSDKIERAAVTPIEPWVTEDPKLHPGGIDRRLRGRIIYVQLAQGPSGEVAPLSVSLKPVAGAVNLRGVITWATPSGELSVQYGIDAFYMQEGSPQVIERAFREKRKVEVQVAIAKSGRARIRNLLVDGVPVS